MIADKILENTLVDLREHLKINTKTDVKFRDVSKINKIIFHCTDANLWSPQRLNDFFINERHFPTCGHHYYVMSKEIYQMVSPQFITYHAAGYNTTSISFSIDYNATQYEKLNISIDKGVYDNAIKMAAYLCFKHRLIPSQIFGHRELLGTGFFWFIGKNDKKEMRLIKTCPGLKINLYDFRYEVAKYIQKFIKENVDSTLLVDGIFGPKTKKAFTIACAI